MGTEDEAVLPKLRLHKCSQPMDGMHCFRAKPWMVCMVFGCLHTHSSSSLVGVALPLLLPPYCIPLKHACTLR